MSEDERNVAAGVQLVFDRASAIMEERHTDALCLNHCLVAFLERLGPMAEDLSGADAKVLLESVREALDDGHMGGEAAIDDLLADATKVAHERGRSVVSERDLGSVLFARAQITVEPKQPSDTSLRPTIRTQSHGPDEKGTHFNVRRKHGETPTLDQFGRDLVAEAREGKLPPLVARANEVRAIMETLCRESKRNPVLLGAAGVGKTAIVEGVAQMIADGKAPAPLEDARIVELRVGSIVAGTGMVGQLEEKMNRLLKEAADERAVLFVDELHMVLGAGSGGHGADVANLLKPVLARGDVAVIGATTDMEYRRIVEQDPAFERRFQPININEMDRKDALEVLRVYRDRFRQSRGIDVDDATLGWITRFADEYLRNRHFPDKGVDLLEQCVAHALVEGRQQLDRSTCEEVCQQLVGMPLGAETRLTRLRELLGEIPVLIQTDVDELIETLRVTVSANDFHPQRPNAVLVLAGAASSRVSLLSTIVADSVFGSPDRVFDVDMAGFGIDGNAEADMHRFLGFPHGYVGADLSKGIVEGLRSHAWATVVFRNLDRCGTPFVQLIGEAVANGYFVDAKGAKQYLSDAVVILSCDLPEEHGQPVGFVTPTGGGDERRAAALETLLGHSLVARCQVVTESPPYESAARGWLRRVLLPAITDRYADEGITIVWDDGVVSWLVDRNEQVERTDEWERALERTLGREIARAVDASGTQRVLRVVCAGGDLSVTSEA